MPPSSRYLQSRSPQPSSRSQRRFKIRRRISEHALSPLLRLFNVNPNLFSIFFEVIRKNIGIAHAHYFQTEDPGHFLLPTKISIPTPFEPLKPLEPQTI